MALGSDPYAVLGVPRDADDAQVAQARRRLSRQYHPDLNPAPDAVARFKEVQRAFDLLSDPVARAEYDLAHEQPGGGRVVRDASGGYGLGGEASPSFFIQPASVDFGLLTPKRPWADAKVTVAWTGEPPASVTRDQGGEWWTVLGAERPNSGCMVFYLRAVGRARTPNGRRRAHFSATVDDTVLTVQLTAAFLGEFPPGALPDLEPVLPGRDISRVFPWLLVSVFFIILVIAFVKVVASH
jgi:curved DNA-binding protein CbpA